MELSDGSKVGVIGGGPAGTLTSYFLLELAERIGLELEVDIYEPKDFSRLGRAGCNMCGGVVSESLVQILVTEGINLPPSVVQRGIDSYVLRTDRGTGAQWVRVAQYRHRRLGAYGCDDSMQAQSMKGLHYDGCSSSGKDVNGSRKRRYKNDLTSSPHANG